jgi:hypothetical protein
MEQIRRANRLFANDSLFLREFLMIPICDKDSPYYPIDVEQINCNINNHYTNGVRRANTIGEPSTSSSLSKDYSDSIDSLTSPDEEHRKYMEEFLEKIDTSIASSKKLAQQQQINSDFLTSSQSEDSLFSHTGGNSFINHNYEVAHHPETAASYQQYYQSMNSHQQARHSLGMSSDSSLSNHANIIVKSNGRHVKNSLQRLERQQDEIFEL